MELKRWLAVGAVGDTVRLVPVDAPSTGPDVFVRLLDAEAAVAAERERCARLCEFKVADAHTQALVAEGWTASELAAFATAAESIAAAIQGPNVR